MPCGIARRALDSMPPNFGCRVAPERLLSLHWCYCPHEYSMCHADDLKLFPSRRDWVKSGLIRREHFGFFYSVAGWNLVGQRLTLGQVVRCGVGFDLLENLDAENGSVPN